MANDMHGFSNEMRLALDVDQDVVKALSEEFNQNVLDLTPKQKDKLLMHIRRRLEIGRNQRLDRIQRMSRVDRVISTWQTHSGEDAKRLQNEDNTGKQTAVTSNLPVMASHLEDLTAFFAEALSPIANPYVSNSADKEIADVVKRLSADVAARGYYGRITRAARSALKYNIGGVIVEWDPGSTNGTTINAVQTPGNDYINADMYNTFWDTTVKDPTEIHHRAEWAGYTRPITRVELLRKVAKGYWLSTPDEFDAERSRDINTSGPEALRLWFDPSRAIPTKDGSDAVGDSQAMTTEDWKAIGLGMPGESSAFAEETIKEHTVFYCWLIPFQHGLLGEDEINGLRANDVNPETFLELWRFDLLDGAHIASARPHANRERFMAGEPAVIPLFLTHMLQDDMQSSQRSPMELIVPFQRLASSMYTLGVESLRRGIYGVTVYNPTLIDKSTADMASTQAVASIGLKSAGDPKNAIANFTSTSGADQAFKSTDIALQMKNTLFPSQALPNQVAGLDRAVSNQVTALVHGAQRGLRMSLRLFDEGVFTPARMEAVRNLQRYEPLIAQDIQDEKVAREFGSGVDALESERIVEAMWRLLMGIVQNQESLQTFDVPQILQFLGQVMRVNTDLSRFVKQQPQQPPQGQPAPGGQQPPMSPEEEAAMAAAAAGQ